MNKRTILLPTSVFIIALLAISSFMPARLAHAAAATCAMPTAPSKAVADQTLHDAYAQWKAAYVTADGANGALRVQRAASDGYDTVSEGIAYGMLFAVYNDDRATFDGLWKYEQMHLNDHGLMHWRIDARGTVTGHNAATDADEDMAAALIAADKLWGGYETDAKHLISLISRYEVEPGTMVVKPGDYWGGSDVMNPSYFSPGYYTMFAAYTGDKSWEAVRDANYKILNNIGVWSGSQKTGLLPDWATANGLPAPGMSYKYSYDASRAPIRLALDSAWSCAAESDALLKPFNTTFQNLKTKHIGAAYNLDGQQTSSDDGSFLVSAAAAAAITSDNAGYRAETWNSLQSMHMTNNYFSDAMRMLSLMVASGSFTNPLSTTKAPETPTPADPEITPAEIAVDVWWPVAESKVHGAQPFKAVVRDRAPDSYKMFWKVDGGRLNPMYTSNEGYPHKQADVDVSGWSWRDKGPYTLTFVAQDSTGRTIASTHSTIRINR